MKASKVFGVLAGCVSLTTLLAPVPLEINVALRLVQVLVWLGEKQ